MLQTVGGFDPVFRAAGDDVDLCWRLQNEGHVIGFSAAAMVWHFRRNTVRAYIKQQMGYGTAEALLFFKHPYRFNLLGQSKWLGRIYGDLEHSLFLRRPVIYYGTFGRALFQTLYEAPASVFAYLPFTLEWNVVAAVLLLSCAGAGRLRGARRAAAADRVQRRAGDGVARPGRSALRRLAQPAAGRRPHLSRAAGAQLAALPDAARRGARGRAGGVRRAVADAAPRLANAAPSRSRTGRSRARRRRRC